MRVQLFGGSVSVFLACSAKLAKFVKTSAILSNFIKTFKKFVLVKDQISDSYHIFGDPNFLASMRHP